MPRFFITKPNDTQERKIKARVDTSSQSQKTSIDTQDFRTEDVSLNVFM